MLMKNQNESKTKIVATIGPVSDSEKKIEQMILAGVDVFRFNMKHGELSWHEETMKKIRSVSNKLKRTVAILMDLQGPEIRTGKIADGGMSLSKGEKVWFVGSQEAADKSKKKMIVIDKIEVLKQLRKGNKVLMDDGFLSFEVIEKSRSRSVIEVGVKVVDGGVLTNRKGVNVPGMQLDIPVLVKRDFECLSVSNKEDVDWVALSFVGSAEDIRVLRKELSKRKIEAGIVAKIERMDALDNLDEIIDEADAVMVARGDLGVEIPLYEVPYWQKEMIRRCREKGKPVITATQMLQSMIDNPTPTRAEISDVANAVYDGTDAIMLSGETASGKYPVESVKVMSRESSFIEGKVEYPKVEVAKKEMGQTAAMVTAANELIECGYRGVCDLSAVVVLTETGKTVRYLSRLRPKLPIIGVTANKKTRDVMKLYWGVRPFYYSFKKQSEMSVRSILEFLKEKKEIKKGQNVVMVYGELWGEPGLTSVVRIQAVV